MEDVMTTHTRAMALGGKWAELAEKMLSNPIKLSGTVAAEKKRGGAGKPVGPVVMPVTS